MITKISPQMILSALMIEEPDLRRITAPVMPNASPAILIPLILSFNSHAAMKVINMGVVSISKEACIGKVRERPLIKSS